MTPTKNEFLIAKNQCLAIVDRLRQMDGVSVLAMALLGAGALETFCAEYPEARDWLTRAVNVKSSADAEAFLATLPDKR